MQEYRVEIKVKNNLIMEKVEAMGFKSLLQFSKATGIASSSLGNIVNMTEKALTNEGKYRSVVYRLCDIFNCLPEELFTANQMETALSTNKVTKKVNEAEVQFLIENQSEVLSLEDQMDKERLGSAINEMLGTLSVREAKVLKMRFEDNMGLEECGKILDVSRERVRQIEAKALRKLRHPSRCNILKELVYGEM